MTGVQTCALPIYRLAHPENCLFTLSKKIFSGSKYPKIVLFNFEKRSTGNWMLYVVSKQACQKTSYILTHSKPKVDHEYRCHIKCDGWYLLEQRRHRLASVHDFAETSVRSPRQLYSFTKCDGLSFDYCIDGPYTGI